MMLKKYLSLYWAFFRASFAADIEYRMNFVTRIVTDIFWYCAQIISFEVIFSFTNQVGSWTLPQARVFLGILFVVDAFTMILFQENLDHFSEKVRKGELDLLLAKPINSQFIISCQRIGTAMIANLVMGLGWLIWSLNHLDGGIHWGRFLWLLILVPSGVSIFYLFRFVFAASAVLFTRAENLQYLWYQLYRLGTRPDTIYVPWLKYTVLTILPVGLIASVPARAVLNPPNFPLFLWTIFVAVFCLWMSRIFWNYVIRNYSSASS